MGLVLHAVHHSPMPIELAALWAAYNTPKTGVFLVIQGSNSSLTSVGCLIASRSLQASHASNASRDTQLTAMGTVLL